MSFMGASGRRRRPAGPWAPPDAELGSARSRSPPPAGVCAEPPLPARHRPIGAGRARPTRQQGRARAPPPHWPAPGPLAPPARTAGGRGSALGAGAGPLPAPAGRRAVGEAAQDLRPPDTGPMWRPDGPGCGSAARRGPGRAAATTQCRRAHHLRGLCRRPESILRRSLHFLAGEPWLSGGSSGRSSSGCGASPQPPLLSGWLEGWKPFWSSPPSSEQEAAAGGGGPAGAAGRVRSCSPMAAASPLCLRAQPRLGAAEPLLIPAPAAPCAGDAVPAPPARRRRTAQASCPQRAAEGRPPPSAGDAATPRPASPASGSAPGTCGTPPAARRGGSPLARGGVAGARWPRELAGRAAPAWLRPRDPARWRTPGRPDAVTGGSVIFASGCPRSRDSGIHDPEAAARVIPGTSCTAHGVICASASTYKLSSACHVFPQQLRGTSVTLNAFDLMLF